MRTRVQQRVLYSESAQVKLGGGRGRFDDKKIRVGPAYQAVIPVLGSWSNADETARAGYVQAQEECPPKTRQTTTMAWQRRNRRRDGAERDGVPLPQRAATVLRGSLIWNLCRVRRIWLKSLLHQLPQNR